MQFDMRQDFSVGFFPLPDQQMIASHKKSLHTILILEESSADKYKTIKHQPN